MKKILFGTLVFSLILSSLVYAEADADKMRERREQREKEQQLLEISSVQLITSFLLIEKRMICNLFSYMITKIEKNLITTN